MMEMSVGFVEAGYLRLRATAPDVCRVPAARFFAPVPAEGLALAVFFFVVDFHRG